MSPITHTLTSKGRILRLDRPVIMGILNATPNSFYTGNLPGYATDLLAIAERMLDEGATLLDVGGASTKPGEPLIEEEEELRRTLPVITAIHNRFPDAWLSVDTYHARVAREAVAAGASIMNDVSGARFDSQMLETVAALRVPYIAMHMQGTPETMQQNPTYTNAAQEIRDYLRGVMADCHRHGIYDIIIDPGFGFGKTVAHNFELLRSLHTFRILGRPILAGLSRKSMICKPLNVKPERALNGTTALHMVALQQGASILRVHDVREAAEVVKLWELCGGM